ncbi:GNAT family N-acetyltransferase [Actinokineospora globicatena]|uniref:UPF0256 protein n=1 Tax=Actinokineospora globicatena TaxID=103729 RepID=A0A9W6QSB3_9PSEU|nr:GNAT family N-acetyltransferase [Actinokineospora globicatena]GLW93764.1 UPF0256 protein [Actinokineospora globicatena]
MDTYTVRELTSEEMVAASPMVARAFLVDGSEDDITARGAGLLAGSVNLGAFAQEQQVGTAQVQARSLCVPGGASVPVGAVTAVAVASDHRRRGLLTRLMRAALPRSGPAVSALWASEAAIYGRFGYGVATELTRYTLPTRIAFRPGITADSSLVRELPRDEAIPVIRALYERYAEHRVGALTRTDGNWDHHLFDSTRVQAGRSPLRFAVHPEGYATYRAKPVWNDTGPQGQLDVHEFIATTPQATADLWRYLLDIDLVRTIHYDGDPDDPLALLLPDTRVALRKRLPALHIRLVDVAAALPLRRYLTPIDVVVELDDPFCPWNTGRWHLSANSGQMTVASTEAVPDLELDIRDLGAAYLGGTRLSALAAAGLVREHTTGATTALSNAMLADREPSCREVF